MCNYTSWHEIKDLVSIYREQEWDDARVVVWDPARQREYELTFTGSSRPGEEDGRKGIINFNISPKNPTWKDHLQLKIAIKKAIFGYRFKKIIWKIFKKQKFQ